MALSDINVPISNPSSAEPLPGSSVFVQRNLTIFRSIGYGLLALSFVDLLYVLLPAEFTNSVWEYQTIGDLVRLLPVPLLALMLVFYGEAMARQRVERWILWLLSWLTLIIGITFFLLIPLTINDTVRISRFNNEKIDEQVSQQKLQLDATQQQLEQSTAEQLQSLVPVPDQNGNLPNAPNSPEQAKAQVLSNLEQARQQADRQADQARTNLHQNLLKNTLKITIELLIGGLIYIYLWSITGWARRLKSYQMIQQPTSRKPFKAHWTKHVTQWTQDLTRKMKRSQRVPRRKRRS